MDKQQELYNKLHQLIQEIHNAKKIVAHEKIQYLNCYETRITTIMNSLKAGQLPASAGGLIGTMRCISEYDSLASIPELYNAAVDVDLFYSQECKTW